MYTVVVIKVKTYEYQYIKNILMGGFAMEYVKDIILNYGDGQGASKDWRNVRNRRKSNKKKKVISKLLDKLWGHKMVVTAVSVTVIFMALDVFLISSFLDLLTKI